MLDVLARGSMTSAISQRKVCPVDLALPGNGERCPDDSFLDPIRPDALHTDFFLSSAFGSLDSDVLQIWIVVPFGNTGRFPTVTAQVLRFSSLTELVASPRSFSANVTNP